MGDAIAAEQIDLAYGGWGQDGHVAYNQARRHPFSPVSIDEVRSSSIRIQDNNVDTIVARAQALKQAGVTHFLGLYFAANDVNELLDQMQVFAEEVIPRIR